MDFALVCVLDVVYGMNKMDLSKLLFTSWSVGTLAMMMCKIS